MFRLIRECRPPTVFGEQVSGALGYRWLAGVFADLESEGYRVGSADLPAACVGAPHIRQRLFWVADTERRRKPGALERTRREKDSLRNAGGDDQSELTNLGRLSIAVQMTGWPTPQSRDGANSRGGLESRTGGRRRNLDDYATLSGWATPAARDYRSGKASEATHERNARPLNEQATKLLSGWGTRAADAATPSA